MSSYKHPFIDEYSAIKCCKVQFLSSGLILFRKDINWRAQNVRTYGGGWVYYQGSYAFPRTVHRTGSTQFKVTVRFKTEGNGQNEIVSHMERSEVKL